MKNITKLLAASAAALALTTVSHAADDVFVDMEESKPFDFSLGTIILGRSGSGGTVLLDSFGSTVITSSNDLLPSLGIDAKASAELTNDIALSARAIGTVAIEQSTTGTIFAGGLGYTDIDGSIDNGLYGGFGVFDFTADVETTSSVLSLETNLEYAVGGSLFSVFVGGRYVRLTDDLDMVISVADLGGASNRTLLETSNDLFGAQIGLMVEAPDTGTRFSGYAAGSVGYYAGNANLTVGSSGLVLGTTNPGAIITSASASETFDTYGADLEIAGSYQMTERAGLTIGYKFMYFDKVAYTVPSLGLSNSNGSSADIGYDSVIYHGLTARLSLEF
ncbi:MAG: BBP7 family outer membrane beta-barrel protein [Pseudomonadota bacterium]